MNNNTIAPYKKKHVPISFLRSLTLSFSNCETRFEWEISLRHFQLDFIIIKRMTVNMYVSLDVVYMNQTGWFGFQLTCSYTLTHSFVFRSSAQFVPMFYLPFSHSLCSFGILSLSIPVPYYKIKNSDSAPKRAISFKSYHLHFLLFFPPDSLFAKDVY